MLSVRRTSLHVFALCVFLLALSARSLAVAKYSVGGTVSGLKTTESVTLLDNGGNSLKVTANGKFVFTTLLASGAAYNVKVGVQPVGESCKVTGGSGTVHAVDVTSVVVACKAKTYTIGGLLSGLLKGDSVTLEDNKKDALKLTANGKFTFKTPLPGGAAYSVTVSVEPLGETCTLAHQTGTVKAAPVTTVAVTCKPKLYTIGGAVSGLASGASLTLEDNLKDPLKVVADGKFTFKTPLKYGATYDVTISAQPAGETCIVKNGSGKVKAAKVTTVAVTCTAKPTYSIGGNVSGLTSGQSVTLLDNGTDSLPIAANGGFVFKKRLPAGAAYNVTVGTQPAAETCSVTGGKGNVGNANPVGIAVSCTPNPTYSIGVTVSGLTTGQSVTLLDNGTDSLTASANGSFNFPAKLAAGAAYNVTVGTQPTAETCTVTGGKGNVGNANVIGIAVSCTPNPTYSIGGSVSGLTTGQSVTLLDNGGNSLTVTSNTSFTFTAKLASGAAYDVTVGTQPAGETCNVTNASGKVGSANVTNVAVACAATTTKYSIGGSVSGLNSGASVTLQNNGGDSITVTSNTTFTFPTKLASGAAYGVTVSTEPTGETCNVTNGFGNVASANITNVAVTCTLLSFNIGGNITGLASGQSVILLDNAGDALTINGTGSSQPFTFDTPIQSGSKYAVTVGTQPETENCTVTAGSGTIASGDVTNVAVACSAIASFTIGGSVSGLTSGTLTLLDNGGDAKNITANGAFTFAAKVGTGRKYAVTVGTDPTGQTCKVTNGSGTVASANISNVAVACSKNGGSGGGTSYWMPYSAEPQANLPQGQTGTTGLFLIPSDKIASAPAPEFVINTKPDLLGIAFDVSTSTPITLTPGVMMYTAVGKDGNTHVYGLVLDDTSTFPTPVQISNLSLDSTQTVCDKNYAQTDLADPTTLFALIQVGDVATFCSTTSTFEVVHYKDSASTAPVAASVNTTEFDTLYTSGTLSGLVMLDNVSSNLYLYANDAFTAPTTLLPKVSFEIGTGTSNINFNDPLHSNTNLFLDITTATGAANPSGLYYIASTGKSASLIHAGSIGSTADDNTNFYFTDITSTTQALIYQVAVTGGAAKLLYTGASTDNTDYNLIGTNDSLLAFYTAFHPGLSFAATNKFFTIPIGSSSASATQIGATAGYTGLASPFLASPNGTGPSGNKIFVSLEGGAVSQSGATFTHSSFVLPFSGSSNPTPTANSVYNPLGLDTLLLGNGAWQVTGIADTNGGWGGKGSVANQTNVSTLANTPFTSTAGGNYALPSGYAGDLIALGTDNIGIGIIASFAGDPEMGLAADLDANIVYQISIVNTDVAPF